MAEEIAGKQKEIPAACPASRHVVIRHDISRVAAHAKNSRVDSKFRGRWALPAGTFRLVAKLVQFGDQPVTVVALDLDRAVLDAAARAACLFQTRRQLLEFGARKWQARDDRHTLAAASGDLASDTNFRRPGRSLRAR